MKEDAAKLYGIAGLRAHLIELVGLKRQLERANPGARPARIAQLIAQRCIINLLSICCVLGYGCLSLSIHVLFC